MVAANPVTLPLSSYKAQHVRLEVAGKLATLTLNRPEKKNPLTFESYQEIADIFRAAAKDAEVKAFVLTGADGNFCSGGDVFEIIGPLIEMDTVGLLKFTRMTGEAVKAMRAAPQPVVAAVDGVCAGAGAILAMASDIRVGTARAKIAFLFNRVGLAGCDMGACAILPRIVGHGRASELLYMGRAMGGEEAERWGFFNKLSSPESVLADATALARELADGPTFANAMTKRMLEMEWAMSVEQAIEAEAVAQALCMETEDFARAYRAFAAKQKPVFEGN
jgi:enoyl-CoA hydratase/carnithine racemase